MTWVEVPVVGQFYQSRNKKQSNQDTINFYPQILQNAQGREQLSLEPMPGNKLFATAGTGKNRGAVKHNNALYVVNGNDLYTIDKNGIVSSSLGAVAGSGRVEMDTDGRNLVIVTGGAGYVYTSSLSRITDGDFQAARTVSYFNDRFIFDTPTGWAATDVGDPKTITSSNVADITSTKDAGGGALGVFSFGQKFYPFSESTIESWWNPGGDVVFSRENFAFDTGVAGPYAHDNNTSVVYFLGSDRIPYRISGLSKQPIGNSAIGQEFQDYGDVSDCKVICQSWDNQNFAWFIFPNSNRSWLFHQESGTWWRMASGTGLSRHAINSAVDIFGKKIICDYNSANIYELDWSTYTDNLAPMYWQRDTAPFSYKNIGSRPLRVFVQGVRIVLETGQAPINGQGSAPQLMLSWSLDNGSSYVGDIFLEAGVSGDLTREVVYHDGMGFVDPHQNIQFRLRMSDPCRWAITDMQINVSLGI